MLSFFLSPAEELRFEFTDASKEMNDILNLTNNTQKQIAYKVKTTSPEKYRVRTSSGLIKPGMTASVSIYLQASTSKSDRQIHLFDHE